VEAVRRLQLPATILEVQREQDSVLRIQTSSTPVRRYIGDAKAVLRAEGVGEELPKRVVPGSCRLAIEAACMDRIHRDRLRTGDSFERIRRRGRNMFTRDVARLISTQKRRAIGAPGESEWA
jgi:hypothetical protein